jgi:hypothetical protein
MRCFIFVDTEAVYCEYLFLLVVTAVKNTISEVVYHEMVKEDSLQQCSSTINSFVIICMTINYLEMALAVFLIFKCVRRICRYL